MRASIVNDDDGLYSWFVCNSRGDIVKGGREATVEAAVEAAYQALRAMLRG